MKKLYILLALTLALTACGPRHPESTEGASAPTEATAAPNAPIGDENTFLLPTLPDIGGYEDDEPERYYPPDNSPYLIPRPEGYGTLYPFAGGRKTFYESWEGEVYDDYGFDRWSYGLCTADGVVVAEPVYDRILPAEEGHYLLISEFSDPDDPYSDPSSNVSIAKTDGSRLEYFYDGKGHAYHVGGKLYGIMAPSWESFGGEKYYYREPPRHFLSEGYYSIYEENGFFVAFNEAGEAILLDMELNVVSDAHYTISAANESYYVFGEDGEDVGYGIARVGSGEVVLDAVYTDLQYANGHFFLYDGTELTVYDDGMEQVGSFSVPGMVNMYTYDGNVITFADPYYDAHYYTRSGLPLKCEEYHYDYDTGYHIFNQKGGAQICDPSLNEVCFIKGESIYRVMSVKDGFIVVSFDSEDNIYLYRPEDGSRQKIYATGDGTYSVRLDSSEGTPLLQVYSDEGTPLFRCYGSYTYSDTEDGRLYHYISGGRAVTCREDGEVIISLPADVYG